MTNPNRIRYANVTGVVGLAVIPVNYSDDDIDAVLNGTLRPFSVQPKFIATITYRARFTIGCDDKIVRNVIVGES